MEKRGVEPILSILALVLAAASIPAQSLVLPGGSGVTGDLSKREGSSALHLPGYYAPSRLQVIYRGRDLQVGKSGFTIGAIGLRRDGLKTRTFKAHRWKLSVTMSSSGVPLPVDSKSASFDGNHGSDRQLVLQGRALDWPALPLPPSPPAPFAIRIKLDKPFVLMPGRNLCVDFLSESLTGNRELFYWYVDSEAFAHSLLRGSARSYGMGCPFGFQVYGEAPALDGESRFKSRAYTRVTDPLGAPAFLWIGAVNSSWGGRSLPMDLGSLGAPGCRIYLAPVLIQGGHTIPKDLKGTALFAMDPLPKDAALQGQSFYQQVLVRDPKGNPLGFRTSNYQSVKLGRIGAPLPARLFYHSGPVLSGKPTASRDAGVVLEILP